MNRGVDCVVDGYGFVGWLSGGRMWVEGWVAYCVG